jgi:ribosomal protein S18 acetylase RimI-like enzyme
VAGISGIALRLASLADCGAMAAVHARARGAYYRGLVPAQELAEYAATLPGRYQEVMARPGMTVRCAEQDAEVVGITVAGPDRDPAAGQAGIARLYQIQVEPSRWRHGIGSRLMAACMRDWQAAGTGRAQLDVWEHNTRARAFYARHGWRPDGRSRSGPDNSRYLGLMLRVPRPPAAGRPAS